jgi:cyanophycin synthetase
LQSRLFRAIKAPGRDYPLVLDLRRWASRLSQEFRRRLGLDRAVYVYARGAEYQTLWAEAARALEAEFVQISPDIWEIRKGSRRTRVSSFIVQYDDPVTLKVAGDKGLTLRLAEEVGVRTPNHLVFDLGSLSEAEEWLKTRAGPCVVKPCKDTGGSMGVTTYVRTTRALRRAAVYASLFSRQLLLERVVVGEPYRLLYVRGELLHAVRRRGVRVTGDGRSTLRELSLRSVPAVSPDHPIALETLAEQGLFWDNVVPRGRSVLVQSVPAGTHGGRESPTVYDDAVTELIGPELDSELKRVVAAVGSEYAGVDVITTNPSVGLTDSGGALIELNTTPALHQHYTGQGGTGEGETPVAVAVLASLLGDGGLRPE